MAKETMTLEQAFTITSEMSHENDVHPTNLQREAKETIFHELIRLKVKEVEPWMEPDFMEGWK